MCEGEAGGEGAVGGEGGDEGVVGAADGAAGEVLALGFEDALLDAGGVAGCVGGEVGVAVGVDAKVADGGRGVFGRRLVGVWVCGGSPGAGGLCSVMILMVPVTGRSRW